MISSSKKDVPLKHQHVPDLFWSFTEVVRHVFTSVNLKPFTESVAVVSAWAQAPPAQREAARTSVSFFISDCIVM